MPTKRPRHFVTESDELAEALDAAARQRPDLSRAQLIVQLALAGHQAAQRDDDERRERRLAAVRTNSGSLTGLYVGDDLGELRSEWPA